MTHTIGCNRSNEVWYDGAGSLATMRPRPGKGVMDAPSDRTFGHLLRRYRRGAGLTHEELAERAHLSARAISALERGERLQPRPGTVRLLAAALGLDRVQADGFQRASQPPDPGASPQVVASLTPDEGMASPSRADPAPRTNLPFSVTSFVGRERELAEVKRLLTDAHLLTLTGTGGCGKTRLALEAAARLADSFPDGLWVVELAPLTDPRLVPLAVAAVLEVREEQGRPVTDTLVEVVGQKCLLLLLDNCEHLIEACASIASALLRSCARVRIVATSREPLGIAGEATRRVPSLSLVDPRYLNHVADPIAAAREAEAVQLFLDRARLSTTAFELTRENAPLVAQICSRLDGIPLAIELAAARLRALPVALLAQRLDDRFRLLRDGNRAALPRQQTLRATFDWSYNLLSVAEQTLFRRLSVFVGGFTLEAAEAVCSEGLGASDQGLGDDIRDSVSGSSPQSLAPSPSEDVLGLLIQLVDKSLVVVEEQERGAWYRLLVPLREYGWDRLTEAGEMAALRDRHRDWCLAIAAPTDPMESFGTRESVRLERIAPEHDNMRAALAWCLEGDTELGLRLAGHLHRFWQVRGFDREMRQWLAALLAKGGASSAARARAL
jgi:predicted ATPase/DNA-binding XRE family transcriptional regulator